MDIIKTILHVFKKSDNAFKIMHPETEVAQITDWNNGIVNTLTSTALGTLVSTLTSDSLLATMIQKVLTATGVKYNIAQNGYLCFGGLFGGLIIQWVYNKDAIQSSASGITSSLPIAFKEKGLVALVCDSGSGVVPISVNVGLNNYIYWAKVGDTYTKSPWFYAIFLGY